MKKNHRRSRCRLAAPRLDIINQGTLCPVRPDLACCARRGGVGSARPAIVIYSIQNLWAPASVEGGSVVAASEARAPPMPYIQSRTSGCPARRGRRVSLTCRVLRYLQFPFRALTIQKPCSQICFGSRAIEQKNSDFAHEPLPRYSSSMLAVRYHVNPILQ